jgi:hypothetical protein
MRLPSRPTAWRLLLLAVAAGLAVLQAVAAFLPAEGLSLAMLGVVRTEPVPPLRQPGGEAPERWAAILERPLFHPGRRPAELTPPDPPRSAGAARAPTAEAEAPGWVLLGTALDGARSSALLRSTAAPHPIILRRGDSLEGWTVQAIARGSVVLERGGIRFQLALPGGP